MVARGIALLGGMRVLAAPSLAQRDGAGFFEARGCACAGGAHILPPLVQGRTMELGEGLVFDRSAARKAVNLSLNEDLVSRAKGLTKNLSATVETLLAGYVREEQAKRRTADRQLHEVIEALNAYHERHGCLSDEYQDV